ncbi:hypothetical protein O9G_001986 [Rozella allomycis CSF55]|uniref:Uncharacterized protein n=1 Tax=Rozella allomycis (strain CSF55) TaxID=988480 RepID=A0A075AWZ7_ROZAC|nr:hypothetical protein O9G_001986 [Rozella allomycis CSF55]|eukprot:EPZ34855.1 hypothetical protein O9G_001986 [Rozella allomycis CSF55]
MKFVPARPFADLEIDSEFYEVATEYTPLEKPFSHIYVDRFVHIYPQYVEVQQYYFPLSDVKKVMIDDIEDVYLLEDSNIKLFKRWGRDGMEFGGHVILREGVTLDRKEGYTNLKEYLIARKNWREERNKNEKNE